MQSFPTLTKYCQDVTLFNPFNKMVILGEAYLKSI